MWMWQKGSWAIAHAWRKAANSAKQVLLLVWHSCHFHASKCTCAHLSTPGCVGPKIHIAVFKQQGSIFPAILMCLHSPDHNSDFIITEAAFSHLKCFHGCSDVTVANIAAHSISETKHRGSQLDRTEEALHREQLWVIFLNKMCSQDLRIPREDGCFTPNYFTVWI